MGENVTLYYYVGNDLFLNKLSKYCGMLFCSIVNDTSDNEYRDEIQYFDPVRKRYITKTFDKRKNLKFGYYIYNSKEKNFIRINVENKIANKRYTRNFLKKNFINTNKIKDQIDLIYRVRKIEKIKNNLN